MGKGSSIAAAKELSMAVASKRSLDVVQCTLLNLWSFLAFHRHHMIEKMIPAVTWGTPCCSKVAIWTWRPLVEDGRLLVLRPSTEANHVALAKLHSKNKWLSSSTIPHLEHFSSILWMMRCNLLPVPRASLSNLQAKVLTLGWISLSFHTCLRICITCRGVFGGGWLAASSLANIL